MTERGKFIVFEGGEGTGKSTQARLLADALGQCRTMALSDARARRSAGREALRRLLVESPPRTGWTPLSEALLHYAARNEHLEKTIRPALARGIWVISDRFADSTGAYQGAGLGSAGDDLDCLSRLVIDELGADLTIVLDLDAEQALPERGATQRDRYESMDLAFHQRVRTAFLEIARHGGRSIRRNRRGPGRGPGAASRSAMSFASRLGIEVSG